MGTFEARPDVPAGRYAPLVSEAPGGRLSGRVYLGLKERLLEGEFAAGRRFSIDALRADFGVSKQPIMEAFRLLAADGLVEILPQSGCLPLAYTDQETADFFRVFAGYEGVVAEAAALRRTEEQLHRLRTVAAETQGLDAEPDPAVRAAAYRRSNRRFHEGIHDMAHSRVISSISRRMWDLSDYLVNRHGDGGGFGEEIAGRHGDHQQILTALEQGDADAARESMASHIRHTVQLLGLHG